MSDVLMAIGTGTDKCAPVADTPFAMTSNYAFLEQCQKENGIHKCDCTVYNPASPVHDSSTAQQASVVPVRVTNRRTAKDLYPSE